MLCAAAFGDRPGLTPLPSAREPVEQWWRAVALGGQGRYSQSRAELTALSRAVPPRCVLASLAASTEASLLRQLGWHRVASGYDGRALAAVGATGCENDHWSHEARCDALTGLAADALGCGRLELGRQLLARCEAHLRAVDEDRVLWRQHVRLHWVTAEIALACADFPLAGRHADTASDLADRSRSVRHQVKSDLLRAASLTGEPDPAPALELAGNVLARCERYGLLPLQWAAAMLVSGLSTDVSARRLRDELAALIRRRGGNFRQMCG